MKIQICSDLHLEFSQNREWLKRNPIIPKGEILIIAGDTYHLDKKYEDLDFIKKVSDEFEFVYLIPGNHEYYGGFDLSTALKPTYHEIKDNVVMLNNLSIDIQGIKFIFSTMWSIIQQNAFNISRSIMDFRKILYNNARFNINDFNELHKVAFSFIDESINIEGGNIVVTHYLPSKDCNTQQFKESILIEAFCVEKRDFILNNNIDYWIYGHSHRNIEDFKIGDTKMITNQLGYVSRNEHISFNYGRIIEV